MMNWKPYLLSLGAHLWVMSLCALPAASPAKADEMPLVFSGRIEAAVQGFVAPDRDGKVAAVYFRGGEQVEKDQPLVQLDDAFQRLAVLEAEARLAASEAAALEAQRETDRLAQLAAQDVASAARLEAAEAKLATAQAHVTATRVALEAAQLAVARSTLRAPVAGRIGRPTFAVGAFVEAKAGLPLAEIVALDPVLVAYEVPWATRLATLEASGVDTLEALFSRVTVEVMLSGDEAHPHTGIPLFADAVVAEDTGTVRVWAQIANPRGLLRPGMSVEVHSTIAEEPIR